MLTNLHWFEIRSTRNEKNSFRLHTGKAKILLIDALFNYHTSALFLFFLLVTQMIFVRLRSLDHFYEKLHRAMKLKSGDAHEVVRPNSFIYHSAQLLRL
jgi:hypothetical protein